MRDISLADRLVHSPAFCVTPFLELYMFRGGEAMPCHLWDSIPPGERAKAESGRDAYWRGDSLRDLRRRMLDGAALPPECGQCARRESLGLTSRRQLVNKQALYPFFGLESTLAKRIEAALQERAFPPPVSVILSLASRCGLFCRTCLPRYNPALEDIPARAALAEEEGDAPRFGNLSWHEPAHFDSLPDWLRDVRNIGLYGGEPACCEAYTVLLRQLAYTGAAAAMNVEFATNLVVWNRAFAEALSPFASVTARFSLDGAGRLCEYLRPPAQWKVLWENVLRWQREFPSYRYMVQPVLQAANALNAADLYRLCLEQGLALDMCGLDRHMHLAAWVLPTKAKELARERLTTLLRDALARFPDRLAPFFAERLLEFCRVDLNPTLSASAECRAKFVRAMRAMDAAHGQSFALACPELHELWEKGAFVPDLPRLSGKRLREGLAGLASDTISSLWPPTDMASIAAPEAASDFSERVVTVTAGDALLAAGLEESPLEGELADGIELGLASLRFLRRNCAPRVDESTRFVVRIGLREAEQHAATYALLDTIRQTAVWPRPRIEVGTSLQGQQERLMDHARGIPDLWLNVWLEGGLAAQRFFQPEYSARLLYRRLQAWKEVLPGRVRLLLPFSAINAMGLPTILEYAVTLGLTAILADTDEERTASFPLSLLPFSIRKPLAKRLEELTGREETAQAATSALARLRAIPNAPPGAAERADFMRRLSLRGSGIGNAGFGLLFSELFLAWEEEFGPWSSGDPDFDARIPAMWRRFAGTSFASATDATLWRENTATARVRERVELAEAAVRHLQNSRWNKLGRFFGL